MEKNENDIYKEVRSDLFGHLSPKEIFNEIAPFDGTV